MCFTAACGTTLLVVTSLRISGAQRVRVSASRDYLNHICVKRGGFSIVLFPSEEILPPFSLHERGLSSEIRSPEMNASPCLERNDCLRRRGGEGRALPFYVDVPPGARERCSVCASTDLSIHRDSVEFTNQDQYQSQFLKREGLSEGDTTGHLL